MLPSGCSLAQHFQHLGHSFLQYRPTLSRQITYLFFSSLSQINFFILSLSPAQKRHALQMQ